MPFKKLHPNIQEKLEIFNLDTPTALQRKSIPLIKSGTNVFCIAPAGSGKTTTLVLTTLHKLKCEAAGDTPRAIILVENTACALALYELFLSYTKHNSLRVYASYDQIHIDTQKSEIALGTDILIATPKSLNKLFLQNGFATSHLTIFSVDDAIFLAQKVAYAAMMSISQSIKKCQYVLYSEKANPKLKRFESYFMQYAKTITQ